MAWLVGDGFDFYTTAGDAATNSTVWGTVSQCILQNGGRFGTGCHMLMGNNSVTPGNMFTTAFANSNVIYVNMNILSAQSHVNGGTTQVVGFTLRDAAGVQCGVFLRNGGDFVITSGSIGSAVLATSSVLMPLASTWAHIQVKITIHNTTGSVELRLNGALSASWSATGLNTRNGTSNFYANVAHLTSSSPSSDFIDDFYVFNDQGAAPNTWQGDVHAVQQFPTSDNAIQWTRNSGTNNCLAVDDPKQDGDTTYVYTNTINFTDTYGMTPLATTPANIVAVVVKYTARMDDAGPHTVTAMLTSGGTTVNLANYNCTNAYAYQQAVYTADPNTSAIWAGAAVNAIVLSIKDVL